MKKSILLFGFFVAFLFTGCGLKPYVDTKDPNYATLQLVPKSKTWFFTDDYYAVLYDYNTVCEDLDKARLGAVETNSDDPSRIVKVAAEKPLYIYTNYRIEESSGNYTSIQNITSTRALRPEKGKHYIIEYERKKVSLFRVADEYRYYILDGKKHLDIPEGRIGSFDPSTDCKKGQLVSK